MMSRSFTRREKILLLVLCVLILGILYYQFIYKSTEAMIQEYGTVDLETDLQIEKTKDANIKRMKAEIEDNEASNVGIVAVYNNSKNEIAELNSIFSGVSSYNIDFAQPIKDGDAVRRNISVTYTASSYAAAEEVIKDLHNCKYRCLIRTISISNSEDSGSGGVSVSLEATFFETMYKANSDSGLELAQNEETTESETE